MTGGQRLQGAHREEGVVHLDGDGRDGAQGSGGWQGAAPESGEGICCEWLGRRGRGSGAVSQSYCRGPEGRAQVRETVPLAASGSTGGRRLG